MSSAPWMENLLVRGLHVMTWCPFCYLDMPQDQVAVNWGRCCSIALPLGSYQMHIPAINYATESPTALVQFMLYPRPWEAQQFAKAGLVPKKRVPAGLKDWLEADACKNCKRDRKQDGASPYARCEFHRTEALADAD